MAITGGEPLLPITPCFSQLLKEHVESQIWGTGHQNSPEKDPGAPGLLQTWYPPTAKQQMPWWQEQLPGIPEQKLVVSHLPSPLFYLTFAKSRSCPFWMPCRAASSEKKRPVLMRGKFRAHSYHRKLGTFWLDMSNFAFQILGFTSFFFSHIKHLQTLA